MGRDFRQVLELLPEGWETKAKELGALQRARAIKTPEDLLKLILLYLTEGKSMAGTSAVINLSDETAMSKIAVYKRIQNSGDWLQWLCTNICRRAGLLTEKPLWLKDRNVLLTDGSKDVKTGKEKQSFMLHYTMDMFTFVAREFLITEEKTGEKLTNFKSFEKNDIVIADRMYGTLASLFHLKKYEADYILRLRGGAFNIYNAKWRVIDIAKQFSRLMPSQYDELTGWLHQKGEIIPVRICALRKSKIDESKGLRRLKKESSGILLSESRKEYNKYIIVITSLGKEVTVKQVLDLYRARWQVELAFKRLKSLFGYNEMPARKPENIKTWFYGKLLLATLCETLVNTGRFGGSTETQPEKKTSRS